jgi:SAM-dependent methyltransferase
MPKPPPAKVIALVEGARNGLRSLDRKLVPPPFALLDFVKDLWGFQIVYTLAELEVPDALANGARSADDIARERGVNADYLYRLLRAATNIDVLRELPGRRFELLPIGEALRQREGESFRDFIVMMGRVGWRFWGRLGDAVRQGKSAIEVETGQRTFDYLLSDEGSRDIFNRAMTAVSAVTADAVTAAYDVSGFHKIVDVGGGHGRLLSALLKSAPDARGVLFDMPVVVEDAPPMLQKYGVHTRVDVVGGDFFDKLPAGGDLYVMKAIIHDWQDAEARKILENVRRALAPGGKVALVETVVTGPNEKHFSKLLDIEMIVHAGGRERTRDEYATLFASAGLRLTRVIATAGPASIVEAEAS